MITAEEAREIARHHVTGEPLVVEFYGGRTPHWFIGYADWTMVYVFDDGKVFVDCQTN